MNRIKWILPAILVASLTFAWESNVSYKPPIANTDGSLLLEQELDFYILYCNDVEVAAIDSIIGQRTVLVDFGILPAGSYPCNLTVVNLDGIESAYSDPYVFIIGPKTPNAPTGLVILPQ